MQLHLWVGIRTLRHFLAHLARNLTGMVLKLQSTMPSDGFVVLFASVCPRSILIFGHKTEVRSDISNIHSADAYDRR